MSDFAQEGGHFYLPSGEPYYTVIAKGSGLPRPATLRDARKVGAVPGITSIIKCAAAPQLEAWKRRQLALACITLPKIDGESADDFLRRVDADWQAEGRAAADKGTAIHGAIERSYLGLTFPVEFAPWVVAAREEIERVCGAQHWAPEKAVASPLGFGTKIDLHCDSWLLDFKTKDGEAPIKVWDEHAMQLAAGQRAARIPGARCGILFVQRERPEAILIEAETLELARGWQMFTALLAYWQTKNGYAGVVQ